MARPRCAGSGQMMWLVLTPAALAASFEFSVNAQGEVVLQSHKAKGDIDSATPDRFEAVRGKADIKWRTDELMALLRGDD